MSINDLELVTHVLTIKANLRGIDELRAQGRGSALDNALHTIELAAKAAQDRLKEIK